MKIYQYNIDDNIFFTSTTTTEAEYDSDIRKMDDVILAVANGRKLGLHKHLPRHFRHRLHHAVNRIQRKPLRQRII